MTGKLPELALSLRPDVQLDGELIAWNDEGLPTSTASAREAARRRVDPRHLRAFDLLALDGERTLRLPYAERHALLEEITIDGSPSVVEVVGSFEDGPALWDAIVERGLEGVVAKRERKPYQPGERLWVKTKNRATARFREELAGAEGIACRRLGPGVALTTSASSGRQGVPARRKGDAACSP
jgi:bifunctional non-homologous end joining protein LigD